MNDFWVWDQNLYNKVLWHKSRCLSIEVFVTGIFLLSVQVSDSVRFYYVNGIWCNDLITLTG